MSKAKAKTTTKAAAACPDAALIRHCIQYAQAVAAASASYRADPDGNNEYAVPLAAARHSAAKKALTLVSTTKATTAMGISAKARIMPMVLLDDDCYSTKDGMFVGGIEAESARFYETFAADVKSYMSAVIEAEWKAALEASKGGAA